MENLNKPPALQKGDTIGIITPSWPANVLLKEKYQKGIHQLHRLGFNVIEGDLTKRGASQGYRTGSILERAQEFNNLYKHSEVKAIIATIGGYCSSSLIPYIDYEYIRNNPKIVCGYSDITALHLALNKQGNLVTFYGPALVPSFGESPEIHSYTLHSWFLQVGINQAILPVLLTPPEQWSNEFIDASKPDWESISRQYKINEGWKILNEGHARAHIRAYNLNTLVSLAGTDYWPALKGKILLIEQMNAVLSIEERLLNQLKLIGVFDEIVGLIISKPENYNSEGAPFSYDSLLLEIIGKRNYPIITNFDCGHTIPMLTIPQNTIIEIWAEKENCSILQQDFGYS